MSFQIIPQDQSSFGKLLTGAAKGFAEQAPKEMERYRLSQNLKNVAANSSNLSPFQQYAELAGAVGNRPDILAGGAEILRQESKKGRIPQLSNTPVSNKPASNPFESERPNANREITPLEIEKTKLTPNLPPTQQDYRTEANRLYEINPDAFLTADEYLNEAKGNLDSAYNQTEALRGQADVNDQTKNDIEKEFNKETSNLGVDFSQKYGDLRQKILNKAYEDVASGKKTKAKAAKDASQEIRGIAKNLNTIKELGAEKLPNPEGQIKSLKELQQKFHKIDEDELFYNELQSKMHFTKPYAKYIANPYTPQYSKYLNSVKTLPNYGYLNNKYNTPDYPKIAKNLLDNLTPDDSIQAGLLKLAEKNYEKSKVLDEIKKIKGKVQLSDLQRDELDINPETRMSLDDIYYFTDFGIPKTL